MRPGRRRKSVRIPIVMANIPHSSIGCGGHPATTQNCSFAAFFALLRRVILHIVCVASFRHAELVPVILHKPKAPRFGFFAVLSSSPVQHLLNRQGMIFPRPRSLRSRACSSRSFDFLVVFTCVGFFCIPHCYPAFSAKELDRFHPFRLFQVQPGSWPCPTPGMLHLLARPACQTSCHIRPRRSRRTRVLGPRPWTRVWWCTSLPQFCSSKTG